MKIRVLSDLHREFGSQELPELPSDVVVLAGDIDRGVKGIAWARQRFVNVPVLYVAGNHEHYDERIGRLTEKLRETAQGSNVTVLENDTFQLGNFRFFGTTLWTDFGLFADRPSAMLAAGAKGVGMDDYRKIRRRDSGKLMPKHTAMIHADSRLALAQFLRTGDRDRSIVITHHAPSIRSAARGKENDIRSAAYASSMEDLIDECGPALWIHGHVHESRDYLIGSTRVVNNPLGYLSKGQAENSAFRAGAPART